MRVDVMMQSSRRLGVGRSDSVEKHPSGRRYGSMRCCLCCHSLRPLFKPKVRPDCGIGTRCGSWRSSLGGAFHVPTGSEASSRMEHLLHQPHDFRRWRLQPTNEVSPDWRNQSRREFNPSILAHELGVCAAEREELGFIAIR